jgi:hypothetical protein
MKAQVKICKFSKKSYPKNRSDPPRGQGGKNPRAGSGVAAVASRWWQVKIPRSRVIKKQERKKVFVREGAKEEIWEFHAGFNLRWQGLLLETLGLTPISVHVLNSLFCV